MTLKPYLWDIFAIGRENKVDLDVADSMFTTNLKLKENKYKGSTVDFATLGEEWNAMSGSEQAAATNEIRDITRKHYNALVAAWEAADKAAFNAILA